MDWDHAIKRNSEVLAGIVETLFVMLGLVGEATVTRLPWPAYRAVLRVLRPAESCPAPTDCRCGTGSCDCARCLPSQAGGGCKTREARDFTSLLPAFRSAATHRVPAPEKDLQRAVPRIHFFNTDGEFITIGPPIRPAKAPLPPGPNPLTAWSMPRGLSAGSRPLRQRWQTFPARPSAWCAGGCGRKSQKIQVSRRRSGRAVRRATAGGTFIRLMNCSASASGWPGRR